MFRVMGVITSDRKHFQIPILCVLRLRRYVCGGGGGEGSKKLGFFFSGHFRIFGGIATI